jgi:hypothetical protein
MYQQDDLVKDLERIFPGFSVHWENDCAEDTFLFSSLHGVYMFSFIPYLSSIQPTQKQWRLLANHLSTAITAGGERENAADTCVLEHLHQLKLDKALCPLLSAKVRARGIRKSRT